MEQNFIYPIKKNFIEGTNNVILLIKKPDIPKNILEYADNNSLKLKNKFHITIIGTKYDLFIRDFISKTEINKRQKKRYLFENIRAELTGLGGQNFPHIFFRPPRLTCPTETLE